MIFFLLKMLTKCQQKTESEDLIMAKIIKRKVKVIIRDGGGALMIFYPHQKRASICIIFNRKAGNICDNGLDPE